MNHLKTLRTLALVATLTAFTVVMLGAATRLLDAGLGCPDWPGCYGRLVVPQAHIAAQYAPHAPLEAEKAWMEMIHRYLAASLGLMALLLVYFSWRARTQAPGLLRWTSLLLALVIVQGAFGAWTVTLKLWPQVVTLHLLGGFSCLLLLSFIAWRVYQPEAAAVPFAVKQEPAARRRSRRPGVFWLALVLLILQIALGGWTSSNYAGIGCMGFPTCNGQWWPDMDFSSAFHLTQSIGPDYLYGQLHASARSAIQWTHRLVALALGLALLGLYWQAGQSEQAGQREFVARRRAVLCCAGLYLLQVTLGIVLVIWSLPFPPALLHTAGAALLMLALVYCGLVWLRPGEPANQRQKTWHLVEDVI